MFVVKTSFEDFIRDCQYVRGLSKATLISYRQSLIAIEPGLEKEYTDASQLRQGLKQAIVLLAESGKRNPAGINVIVRSLNSWLGWALREGQLDIKVVLKKMKEPIMEIQILSEEDIQKWVRLKPKAGLETTIRMMVLCLLDTGLRVAEALDVKKPAVNWDDLLITVIGKGKKQRTIPFLGRSKERVVQVRQPWNGNGLWVPVGGWNKARIPQCRPEVPAVEQDPGNTGPQGVP